MLPLEGIRVLDLTVVWAGPFATAMLGDMGAEVIRVESINHSPATTRGVLTVRVPRELLAMTGPIVGPYPDGEMGDRFWDRWGGFNWHGRNKLSMTVDLRRARGRDIFRRLVELSDVLIENNGVTVFERLELPYRVLRDWNPRLIMVSMPSYGQDGPYSRYVGVGANVEAVCGFTWLRGYADSTPETTASVYHMDGASGAGAAFAVLAALAERDQTGEGQFIDFAQAENLLPQIGEILMDYTANGVNQRTIGNRHRTMAPHGVYPCDGDDRWLTISVSKDEEWAALCRVMDRADLIDDPRFADAASRHANQDDLDGEIMGWTLITDAHEAMRQLQAAGVPAGVAFTETDLVNDPQVRARGFLRQVTHRECGTHLYPGPIWQTSGTPLRYDSPAPCLGEHNEYVYKTLLGVSDEEYEDLVRDGHIGDRYVGK